MELNIKILSVFFEDPIKERHIREVSRLLKINHTTVRTYFNNFIKQGILNSSGKGVYKLYKIIQNKKFLNMKFFYNLEKLRKSKLIEILNKEFDYPEIVLFGSYSQAQDNIRSDIDICLITNINKELQLDKFRKILNRNISLHIFSDEKWKQTIKNNPELINNICKGFVLSEDFEVFR